MVIGILIALQINNWNQARLNNIIETETLINLKQDLDSAMVQLDNKIFQNEIYRHLDSTAMELIHNKAQVSNDSLYRIVLSHVYTPTFDPELGALNEILSTGKMELIKNETLRNHISSWNRYMDELDEVDKRLIFLDDNVKMPLYSKHIPYRNSFLLLLNPNADEPFKEGISRSNFEVDFSSFFYTLEFENMYANYLIYGQIQNRRLMDIKYKIKDMVSIIENYLNSD